MEAQMNMDIEEPWIIATNVANQNVYDIVLNCDQEFC